MSKKIEINVHKDCTVNIFRYRKGQQEVPVSEADELIRLGLAEPIESKPAENEGEKATGKPAKKE